MPINANDLTREQIREIMQRQRAGYEQMENDRLREEWREPTIEEKDAFDRLMHDVWVLHQRKGGHLTHDVAGVESHLIAFYRKLLRLPENTAS